jgi:Amt family ammonium transporter
VAFVVLWTTFVYFPVCHWVFNLEEGWIAARLGASDFAGGTAVHINAGAAALALTLVLGKRRGWPREQMKPHNLPLVLLGAGCCGSAGTASTPARGRRRRRGRDRAVQHHGRRRRGDDRLARRGEAA